MPRSVERCHRSGAEADPGFGTQAFEDRGLDAAAHAGRKGSSHTPWDGGQQIPLAEGGWQTEGPSAVPHKEGELAPLALDAQGLARIRDAFAAAAKRAERLGLDALELHCAHGYLLHQFLSPISNRRTDQYGGSLQNRLRYPLEVFDAVRAAFPQDKPVGIKVSSTDWVEGGWDIAQTIELARELKKRGVDWIDASSGGVSPLQKIPLGPGYQVPFAQALKEAAGVNTIAVGLITQPKQAEDIIASGKADMVALARGMLYDPRWGWHAAAELGGHVAAPPAYWRAPRTSRRICSAPRGSARDEEATARILLSFYRARIRATRWLHPDHVLVIFQSTSPAIFRP